MTDALALPLSLRIKHGIATSALAGPVGSLRQLVDHLRGLLHPELGLLRQEGAMTAAMLARIIKPDWHCVDVGAHLGSVAYQLANLAPRGQLTMIEASPSKARQLARRFPQATLHAVAVSDREGPVTFFENRDQPGFSSLADRHDRGATRETTVQARRLDDLIGAHRVDFVKIDVEGFEYPALRGGEAVLRRDRPVILFEAGAADDQSIDTDQANRLFAFLNDDLGYAIYAVFDLFHNRPPLTPEMFASYRRYPFLAFNYFAMPSPTDGTPSSRRGPHDRSEPQHPVPRLELPARRECRIHRPDARALRAGPRQRRCTMGRIL